jgi:hypothetical protein
MTRVHRLRGLAGTLCVLLLAGEVAATEAENSVTEFGFPFDLGIAVASGQRRPVPNPHPEIELRYVRLQLRVSAGENVPWTVTIRAPSGAVITTFDQSDSKCINSTCWTVRLPSPSPMVEFQASGSASLHVVGGVAMPTNAATPYYSAFAGSVIQSLAEKSFPNSDVRSEVMQASDNLGMFIGFGPSRQGTMASWCCSGVRLSDELFMTNWHCGASSLDMPQSLFWGEEMNACNSGLIDLSWDGDSAGREYACVGVESANRELDVVVLRLGKLADGPDLTRVAMPVQFARTPPRPSTGLAVLHHPACRPKSITSPCQVWAAGVAGWTSPDLTDFTHNCTTETGSSGAPVFDEETMEIVGVHHFAANPNREPGNFAVSAGRILKWIEDEKPALFREMTRGRE